MKSLLETIHSKITKDHIYTIVFFGDSIASAEWVHPNWREIIEYVLKEELAREVDDWKQASWRIRCINSGLDGSTSGDWLKKADDYILKFKPDLTISIFGGNDLWADISKEKHQSNIHSLLKTLSTHISKNIFCSTLPGLHDRVGKPYDHHHQAIKAIKFPPNVQFIDLFQAYKSFDRKKLFTFISEAIPEENIQAGELDTSHPNQLGNAYIAKVILDQSFGIEFDPQKYIKDTLDGQKYPAYQ